MIVLAKLMQKTQSEIIHVSSRDVYGIDFIDVQKRKPNLDKLKKLTGFKPQWVIEKTVDEAIASYYLKK